MDETKEQRLKVLRAKREQFFTRLQQLYDCGKKIKTNNAELSNFRIRFNTLEETKNRYVQIVDEINILKLEIDKDSIPNFKCLDAFDEIYCHILEIAKEVFTNPLLIMQLMS